MARRLFFVEGVHNGRAEIVGEEAQHLTKVLRVEPGQRYEISDNNTLYLGEVETARRSHVVFRVLERLDTRAEGVRIRLLAALIKFDHFEWMIEKATELGVESITPVIAARTDYGLDCAAPKRAERWIRILRESSQQCRRWRTPQLGEPQKLGEALTAEGIRFFLDEGEAQPILVALPAEKKPQDTVSLLIGPEGGWTDQERRTAIEAGWTPVSLGPTILRAETAAIAALAIISAAWQMPDT